MEARPIVKIELTTSDKVLEIAGWTGILLLWIITITVFSKLPEIIPTHFDLSGKPNVHGSKSVLFLLPTIGSLVFIGLTVLNFYPHHFNLPVQITEENAERQYQKATRLIRLLKIIIAFLFSLVVFLIYQSATSSTQSSSFWLMPLVLSSLVIPIAYYIFQSIKKK